MIKVKHINAKPVPNDGERIYIDRLWCDGAFTKFVQISDWNQDIAPSYDLWRFHFELDKWDQFVRLYKEELSQPQRQQALQALFKKAENDMITLVYGNGDAQHNCALVLKESLEEISSSAVAA